ncbi:MAG: DNA polymerase III subunit delta' [Cellvibrionaceae bacterium]
MIDTTQKTLMPFSWQKDLWETLMKQFQLQKMPHGLLVQGVPGLGKNHFAFALAQAILCLDPAEQIACGECKSCQLLISESHPDYLQIEPESEGKAIKIDQIRELVSFLSKTSQQGGFKCIVITPADMMNENSKNALLKSLEEPQGDTIIILVSSHPSRLSATIRSRCQSVTMRIPPKHIALEWLAPKVGDTQVSQLLESAYGAPIAALEAYKEDLPGQISEFETVLDDVLSGKQTITGGAKRTVELGALKAIDFLLTHLGETLSSQLTVQLTVEDSKREGAEDKPESALDMPPKARLDKKKEWSRYAFNSHERPQLMFRFRDKVLDFKRLLLSTANPNPHLLWEEILMDWIVLNRRKTTIRPQSQTGR